MSLLVPDGVRIYEADEDVVGLAIRGDGIMSGGTITAQGTPNMTVNVAAGEMRMAGVRAAISTGSNPIAVAASDPSNPRVDLVRLSSGGVPSIVTGTAGSTPKPPVLIPGYLLLGYISVAAAAANIQNSNITQRQAPIGLGTMAGTLAARPAATATRAGELYFVTDGTDGVTLYRSDATTWTQTASGVSPTTISQPNLVLNSDFSRRTVFGLAMPEVLADTNGAVVTFGTLGTVAANVLTVGARDGGNNWGAKWGGGMPWRDGRWSATFKAVAVGDVYDVQKHFDINNWVAARMNAGTFYLSKNIAGSTTNVANVAQALTLNNWYWIEVEAQGSTYIAKLYNTGGTVPGVTKASSTLLQTLTGTIADAAVVSGQLALYYNGTSAIQWGGIATGNGGVYVETWLPESWMDGAAALGGGTFIGTLGGQAIGFDETADSGPLGKQWALRVYIPAASRRVQITQITPDGSLNPSTTYAGSVYMKTSGKGGSGTLIDAIFQDRTSALGSDVSTTVSDAAETVWTRKTGTVAAGATGRRGDVFFNINSGATATGTAYFMLPQLEQGSAATAWRGAPADDGPLTVLLNAAAAPAAITSASAVEVDSRDLATNLFMPWDGVVVITPTVFMVNGGLNQNSGVVFIDGGAPTPYSSFQASYEQAVANKYTNFSWTIRVPLSAGKHRIALRLASTAGTLSFSANPSTSMVVATRGK